VHFHHAHKQTRRGCNWMPRGPSTLRLGEVPFKAMSYSRPPFRRLGVEKAPSRLLKKSVALPDSA